MNSGILVQGAETIRKDVYSGGGLGVGASESKGPADQLSVTNPFNSRINSGQTVANENFFDGAAFGYTLGHQQNLESAAPVESILKMKIIYYDLFGSVWSYQRRFHQYLMTARRNASFLTANRDSRALSSVCEVVMTAGNGQ